MQLVQRAQSQGQQVRKVFKVKLALKARLAQLVLKVRKVFKVKPARLARKVRKAFKA